MYGHGRNQDLLTGQNPPARKRKQRYINSRPAAATAPSLVRFPLGFLAAFVDVILVLTPGTAKCSVGSAAQEHLLAVLTQSQGLLIVHQHEAEHHLNTQQQRMKVPINGWLIQQFDVVAGGDPAKGSHGLAVQPPCVLVDRIIGKISENRFARADLEHILLCVDDDMRMEALRQTNYVKSIVTAQGKMDLERKGKQSYQGWMCARLLAFSNGDLQALFDRSDGFYRRQLVLTTKEKPAGRIDDPDLAEKMKAEVEGILLWAFEGLQRLAANNFKFTESQRTKDNREAVKRDNNNIFDFLDSDGYIHLKADASASSKELYEAYQIYCAENSLTALKPRSFSEALIACQNRYNLEYCNNVTNAAGRRVRGFLGIEVLVRNNMSVFSGDSMRTYVPEDVPEEWRR